MASDESLSFRVALRLLPPLGAGYLRLVHATMRLQRIGLETAVPEDGGPVIYCFWHSQLAMMPWMQFRRPSAAPISQSRDGELTARIFRSLHVEPIRGSSSRAGAIAARGMLKWIAGGGDAGITPDGPRGPAQQVQPGATWLAKASGRPLLPVAFACTRRRRLGTWDRMTLPLPFARGVFVYGQHLWVPRKADAEALQSADGDLTEALETLSERARGMLLT